MNESVLVAPPAIDEIEVSVFGPGRGEAIVIHIGGQRWITIDSCRDERTGAHPVLDYFGEIGVDVASQVVLVVGTHAHDDHTAGISDIYSAAKSAMFVTSSAFTGTEFFSAVIADQSIEDRLIKSVRSEYRNVFAEAQARPRDRAPHILRAYEKRELLREVLWEGGPEVRIQSLSPSDVAIQRSHTAVAEGAAREDSRARLAGPDPNEYTVAIWIEIGDTAVLLGGDLLIGPTGSGWKRIAEFHNPAMKASLFKVPHHGSKGAHLEATWTELLDPSVVSLIAPFRPSSIPRPSDVARVLDRSSAGYITAKSTSPAPRREIRQTRSLLPAHAQNVRERDGQSGHIQARIKSVESEWRVRVSAPAHRL